LKKILLTTFLVIALTLSFAAPAFAYDLLADGEQGSSDRVVVEVESGSTLGDLASISWDEYLDYGYAPHVDVIIDTGEGSDALVFEYAYNTSEGSVRPEGQPTYGSLTGVWYETFSDDGNGPAVIDDSAYAWLSSGPAGGPDIIGGTLSDWKAGNVDGSLLDILTTPILRLEVEIDNWLADTSAQVENIQSNIMYVAPPEPEPESPGLVETDGGGLTVGGKGCDTEVHLNFEEGWQYGKTLDSEVSIEGDSNGNEYALKIDAGTEVTLPWNPNVMATYLYVDIAADGEVTLMPKYMTFSKPVTLTVNGETITFTEISGGKPI